MNEQVKILRAFRPGDVVFIEFSDTLSFESYERCANYLNSALEGTGVKGILLSGGLRVAAAEERSETP